MSCTFFFLFGGWSFVIVGSSVLVVLLSEKKKSSWEAAGKLTPESIRFLTWQCLVASGWPGTVWVRHLCAHACLQEARCERVKWLVYSVTEAKCDLFFSQIQKGHSGYFISQFISNQGNSTFFMSLLNNNWGLCYIFIRFIAQCLHVLIGSVWEQGNVITVVVFFFMTVGQRVCSKILFFLCVIPAVKQSIFITQRCEVSCCERTTEEKQEEWRAMGLSGQRRCVFVCVRPAKGCPPPSCYSSSSRCFLALVGPWPFLREPFWGRSRCPRSCSVHGTPPCPSSLSRSESECMRAEEVGAGTGFKRAECQVEEKRRGKDDVRPGQCWTFNLNW